MAAMEGSASSLLQESLNLGDVFGSRYLDSPKKGNSALAMNTNNHSNNNNHREKHTPSPATEECSESESDSDDGDTKHITEKSSQVTRQAQTRPRRRPRVVSETTQRLAANNGSSHGGGPRSLVRRAAAPSLQNKAAQQGNGSHRGIGASEHGSGKPTLQSMNDDKEDLVRRRKTPTRQRANIKRGDPRAQNQGIGGQHPDEKERPARAGVRRAVSTSGTDLLSSPVRSQRRLIRKDTAPASETTSTTRKKQQQRPTRTSSPRRCASPRRAKSPRKYKASANDENSNRSGRSLRCLTLDETSSHRSGKESNRGRQTPTSTMDHQPSLASFGQRLDAPSPEVEKTVRRSSEPDSAPQFPTSQPRPGTLLVKEPSLAQVVDPNQPHSPRSLNEAEDGLVEEASRSSQADNNTLKPYSTGDGDDSSSNDVDWDVHSKQEEDPEGVYQAATVLQFDPTQADNVFRAKQVANPSSDLHVKKSDGTEEVFNISSMQDPLSGSISMASEHGPSQPIFDFLGDQPNEEQQEHTERSEREAFDEGVRLKEMLPPSTTTVAEPKLLMTPLTASGTPQASLAGADNRAAPGERPQGPKKRHVNKKGKVRPMARTKSNAGLQGGKSEARPAPARRGVKTSKTMPSRQLQRKSSEMEIKPQKKLMVNDSKNYSQFFTENPSVDTGTQANAEHTVSKPTGNRPIRPRPKQRQRRQAADDNVGFSESEAEGAPKPRRVVKKKMPTGEQKPRKPAANQDMNDSFAFSDTERIKKPGNRRSNNDSFALSDTEALHVKRREVKNDFKAGPFPNGKVDASFNASFSASFSQDQTPNAEVPPDPFDSKSSLGNSIGAPTSLFANTGATQSPGNPLENSSAFLVSETDTDNSVSTSNQNREKERKSHKSGGIASSIGRYFGRKNGKGNATDTEDNDNASVHSSASSRFFGANRRAKSHHLLLDGGSVSSEDDSFNFDAPS